MSLNRRCLLTGAAAFSAVHAVHPANAQAFPSRPIRIVVPFPAGGSADVSARLLAEHLRGVFGQPVTVESKVGAGGNLAAAEAARAEPDGHTLFVGTNGTQAINQSLYARLPYDPQKDFAIVGMLWQAPQLVVVHPAVEARTLAELITAAKAGALSYGSSGIGSPTHLFGELFKARADVALTHVPYRGQGPALTDLVGGQIQVMFPIVSDVLSHARSGAVRPLAVAAPTRTLALPDVPTTAEAGYADVLAAAWTGLYVPAETPPATLARLREATVALLATPTFNERMGAVGIEVARMTPDAAEAFTAEDRRRWAAVIGQLKLKLE